MVYLKITFLVACSLAVIFATGCATNKTSIEEIQALETGEEIAIHTIEEISISQRRGDIMHMRVQDANSERIRGSLIFLCCESDTTAEEIVGKVVEVDLRVIEKIYLASPYKEIKLHKRRRKLSTNEKIQITLDVTGTIIICLFSLGAGCQ